MNEILPTLLEEFRANLVETADSIPREIEISDIPTMIQVAIGIRRSGKTYLLYQKIRELQSQGISLDRILFLNFEDDRLLPMDQKQLSNLLETFYTLYPQNHDRECYFFLDEIQNVDGWQLVIRRFFDTKKVRIFLTGSSAKLLSKEIASSLRGRSIASEVWPYSFHEWRKAHAIDIPKGLIGKKTMDEFYHHVRSYFTTGGFPAIQSLHDNERRTVLQSYVDTVVFRDIIERYKITNVPLIKYLIKILIQNVAAPFSVNKFFKDVKSQGYRVSKDSVYQYMAYIEDAFLAFSVPIFSPSLRKIQVNPKKIYIVDNGLVCANSLGISNLFGSLFENQIYLDLRRSGKKIWYYQTEEGFEVDFVVKNLDGSFELLQVVWDMSNPKTMARETRALEQAQKELGMKGKIVTFQDYIMMCR